MALTPTLSLENNIYLIQDKEPLVCTILLGKNYVTYCISDEEYKTVFHLHHYDLKNQVVGKSHFESILQNEFVKKSIKTNIAIDSLKSTLVPNEFFNENEKEIYFTHLHEILPEETILQQTFSSSLHDLFIIKKATQQFLISKFKNVHLLNASACLLANYPDFIINEHEESLFLAIKEDYFTLTYYKKNGLQLHQIFYYTNENDVLYYIANIVKQFELDKETVGIHLHGETSNMDTIQNILKEYFYHVRFTTRIKNIQYPDRLYAHPVHYFFNLFSIFKCV